MLNNSSDHFIFPLGLSNNSLRFKLIRTKSLILNFGIFYHIIRIKLSLIYFSFDLATSIGFIFIPRLYRLL